MDYDTLSRLVESSIKKAIGDQKRVAVAFSGGVDSTTIAKIASRYCDIDLITVGLEDSDDLLASRICASELNEGLSEVIVDEATLRQVYNKAWELRQGTLVDVELMSVIYLICDKAKKLGDRFVLFGSGAEELFIGYSKYYEAFEKGDDLDRIIKREVQTLPDRDIARAILVAEYFGLEAKTPFMDKELVDYVLSIPARQRIGPKSMKKPMIREVAKRFDVPSEAVGRQKKAMQYGSNVHKTFLRLLKKGDIEAREPRPPFVYD